MIICGLNKTTLLDYPDNIACTVFIGGCNFRCPFCHNPALVEGNFETGDISKDEFFSFLRKRKGVLTGVCITGGEPTLHPMLPDFIEQIKKIGYKVKLDTNGSNPQMLKLLIEKHCIDYVAMDIKNSLDKYSLTIGMTSYDTSAVEESVRLLKNSEISYEFRTTVVKEFHNGESFEKIGKWLKGARAYYLQQFEDRNGILGQGLSAYSEEELNNFCRQLQPFFSVCGVRGI